MTRRGIRLLERSEEEIDALLGSELQREATALVASLVTDLRAARRPADYYEFQRVLAAHVHSFQERQAAASRNAKRERSGHGVPGSPLATWDLTLIQWDRAVRQLRSVGDALAWRLFDFDRRAIVALSRNAPPGPMFGKEGLDSELGAVTGAWERDGDFALLHDLTNSLRIGDLTIFTKDGPRVAEVKKSGGGGSRHREQIRRAERAVQAIVAGGPLGPGEHKTVLSPSDEQLKTHLPKLRRIIETAAIDGLGSTAIGDEQVLTVLDLRARTSDSREQLRSKSTAFKQRALDRAGLASAKHVLRGRRADRLVRDAHLAPFTIFPFSPSVVAALTTDYITYESLLGWRRFQRAFERQGFVVECLLPDETEANTDDIALLIDRRRDARITIHRGAIDQLLNEVIDVDRYAAAIAAAGKRQTEGSGTSIMTFANERATWR